MCSVVAWISKVPNMLSLGIQEVSHLLNQLHHRGPDAKHLRKCSATTILGSNRLRITDAQNVNADMPLVSIDSRYTLVFNGEIYNFKSLRKELGEEFFNTNSDSEVLLMAYAKWGSGCLEKLEGMFAFCIHDSFSDITFIACDPTGQKTIYIYEDQTCYLVSSEIDPLISNPHRKKDLNLKSLAEFIAHRFIIGENTHVNQIRKLNSGTWVELSSNTYNTKRYYTIPIGNQLCVQLPEIEEEIRYAVENSCLNTFNLEVPYALLLSGGIDSTAILASATKHKLPISTFSIGFKMPNLLVDYESITDEFEYSRKLAEIFQTLHTELLLDDRKYCEYLDRWTDICGEPLGSQEAPCLTKLLETCQSHDIRVVFCGAGPDELFDGYSYGKQLQNVKIFELPNRYFKSFCWIGDVDLQKLMPEHDPQQITTSKYQEILNLYPDVIDPLQAIQILHFHGRLRSYEFRQMDQISMHFSIECRSPLIDKKIIESAFNFNPILKQLNCEKGIYKSALKGLVPEFIINRQKQGFPIPPALWFSDEFEQRSSILFDINCKLVKIGLIDINYLKEIWKQKDFKTRNIFSRLYTLEKILQRQWRYFNSIES